MASASPFLAISKTRICPEGNRVSGLSDIRHGRPGNTGTVNKGYSDVEKTLGRRIEWSYSPYSYSIPSSKSFGVRKILSRIFAGLEFRRGKPRILAVLQASEIGGLSQSRPWFGDFRFVLEPRFGRRKNSFFEEAANSPSLAGAGSRRRPAQTLAQQSGISDASGDSHSSGSPGGRK